MSAYTTGHAATTTPGRMESFGGQPTSTGGKGFMGGLFGGRRSRRHSRKSRRGPDDRRRAHKGGKSRRHKSRRGPDDRRRK